MRIVFSWRQMLEPEAGHFDDTKLDRLMPKQAEEWRRTPGSADKTRLCVYLWDRWRRIPIWRLVLLQGWRRAKLPGLSLFSELVNSLVLRSRA